MQPTVVIVEDEDHPCEAVVEYMAMPVPDAATLQVRLPRRDTASAGPTPGGGAYPHALSVLVVDDETDAALGRVAAGRAGSPEPHDGLMLEKPFSAGEVKNLLDRFAS